MKTFLITLAGLLSALYLANPTLGVFELLPDNIPFVGNVDEATASLVLLGVLRYFGYDPTDMFTRKGKADVTPK